MAKKPTNKLTDKIRRAMDDSGQTRYRIYLETGINQSQLSKFYHGAGLSLDTLDRLADYLGLDIVARKQTKSKGK